MVITNHFRVNQNENVFQSTQLWLYKSDKINVLETKTLIGNVKWKLD